MKKIFSTLLFVVLVASLVSVCAESENTFDYTMLEDVEGYSYDKFSKTWMYQQYYVKDYSDAMIVVGFVVYGDINGLTEPPFLFARILDRSGELLYLADEILLLVEEKLYTFENMVTAGDTTAVILGNIGVFLMSDLMPADNVSVKLNYDYSSISFDIPPEEFAVTLKLFAAVVDRYSFFSYFDMIALLDYDIYFNATVE